MESNNKTYTFPNLMLEYKELSPDYHVYVAMIKLGHGMGTEYQVVFISTSTLENAVASLREHPSLEAIVNIEPLTNAMLTLDEQAKREQTYM